MKTKTDQDLVIEFLKGNPLAFDEIVDRYYKRIEYYFYKMLWNDKEKAEDFCQDLFLKLIEKLNSFDTEKNFKTWVFSIANNMCKNEYRKNGVEEKAHEIIGATINSIEKPNQVGLIDQKEFMHEFMEALENEPHEKKSAFVLKHLEFLSIKEISKTLNLPEGTIKSGLHYTAKRLVNKLSHFKFISYE